MPADFTPSRAVAAGSQRLHDALARNFDGLQVTLGALAGSAQAPDVHRGRVHARRLRSLLKTYRPLLDRSRAKSLRDELRAVAQALGAVREADVRAELLLLVAARDERMTATRCHELREALSDAGHASREQLLRRIGSPDWADQLAGIRRATRGPGLIESSADLARILKLASRPWKRLHRQMRETPVDFAGWHELRLALKHCRYALEPIGDLAPKRTARLLRVVRAAQDTIGEHRDTVLASHWVESHARTLGRETVECLATALVRHERRARKRALRQLESLWPEYRRWRRALRKISEAGNVD